MTKSLLIVLAVGVVALLIPSSGAAQYYWYYSRHYAAPPPPAPPPAAGARGPRKPLYYRLGPDPLLYWKWNQQNAFSDFLQYQRSPLNPESDLSYMLRTF